MRESFVVAFFRKEILPLDLPFGAGLGSVLGPPGPGVLGGAGGILAITGIPEYDELAGAPGWW